MSKHRAIYVPYKMSPILERFHYSPAFRRAIMGPRGSGKSTACCMEIWRRAHLQTPGPDGTRRTRFVVVRNAYPELRDTTLRTWLQWFPEMHFGELHRQEMRYTLQGRARDGGYVESEILFRALDTIDDVHKVLSLEVTGAWVNEAREIPKGIIDALEDTVGRYPAIKDGGPTWRGLIMDTNPPDTDHWWYRLAEEEHPEGWEFFRQPGGLIEKGHGEFIPNPAAENLEHLQPNYYTDRMAGKALDHIRVYYCSQYGFVRDGKPVHPDYVDQTHAAPEDIPPVPGIPIHVGMDFGRTPAAIFAQRLANGRWHWIDEIVTEDCDATGFAALLGAKMRGPEYRGYTFICSGDPAGDTRVDTDSNTPYLILAKAGIMARPVETNDPEIRRGALAATLRRLVDGRPGFQISPRCRQARKGLMGGWCYKRIKVAGDERYKDEPDKSRYSHVCEAGEYAMLGAGEGRALIGHDKPVVRPRVARAAMAIEAGWMGA